MRERQALDGQVDPAPGPGRAERRLGLADHHVAAPARLEEPGHGAAHRRDGHRLAALQRHQGLERRVVLVLGEDAA